MAHTPPTGGLPAKTNGAGTPAKMTDEQVFGLRIARMARQQCERLLGTEAGQQASQRITMGLLGAMHAARDPKAFFRCTDVSIASAIALSAQTGLLPGGPYPPVYLVPQAPRKGEQPALQWRLNHRGISMLAYRAGFAIRSIPIPTGDICRVMLGEIVEHVESDDEPPTTLADLKGVAVVVRDLERGRDIARCFVSRATIERRRALSRDLEYGPWKTWPVEMAQGVAIRYLLARGSIPMDSAELSVALAADSDDGHESAGPVIDAPAAEVKRGLGSALDAAGVQPAIGQDAEQPERIEEEPEPERERTPVEREPGQD